MSHIRIVLSDEIKGKAESVKGKELKTEKVTKAQEDKENTNKNRKEDKQEEKGK